jgi:hypothetical protein
MKLLLQEHVLKIYGSHAYNSYDSINYSNFTHLCRVLAEEVEHYSTLLLNSNAQQNECSHGMSTNFAYSAYAFIATLFGPGFSIFMPPFSWLCIRFSKRFVSRIYRIACTSDSNSSSSYNFVRLRRAIAKSVPPLVRLPKRQGIPLPLAPSPDLVVLVLLEFLEYPRGP